MALGIVPGELDSAIKSVANLKTELDKEKAARKATQIEVDTLTRVVKDLKISTDKFAAQIPTLEDKVKHLENKVVDGLNKVKSPFYFEHTTRANDNYKK
jgi:predicted  nucleic acid-binding Zn-ribbon protein